MAHHRRGLRRLLKDDALADALEEDFRAAGLSDRRVAMLGYAEKLTVNPSNVTQADVEELRGVGMSDRDILDLVEVTAYFAYANRIADGLGIQLEPWVDFND